MALMERKATSRALSQELGSFARQKVSTNSSTTFAAARTLSSETMTAATLDAASQTSMPCEILRFIMIMHKRIVRTFLETENVWLFTRPARSPDLSPIENVLFMVTERLARHHTPVTKLMICAWVFVTVHAIQSLFDSIPRCMSAVITARGGYSGY
ncbi:hypothetical protein TNCV_1881401 [Trichonephila clavipes]|nr:hypothetical protein TNCV_1881401 [Trichonephila clavipes]